MKIRIYAILPTTEKDTLEPVSSVIEIVTEGAHSTSFWIGEYVGKVCALNPEWREINIERLSD